MNDFIKVLMERDGLTQDEVLDMVEDWKDSALILIEEGLIEEAEESFVDYFGLETDYLPFVLGLF